MIAGRSRRPPPAAVRASTRSITAGTLLAVAVAMMSPGPPGTGNTAGGSIADALRPSTSSAAAAVAAAAASSSSWTPPRPIPPAPLVIGYVHDANRVSPGRGGNLVEESIERGVNVVCWSFVDMVSSSSESESESEGGGGGGGAVAAFRTNLDLDAIRRIRSRYPRVLHLAAIGGWNGPHPPPGLMATGEEWCRTFVEFNARLGHPFDGIDWDLEGHDDRDGPTSRFLLETLDVMADFSSVAKRKYGMVVSMAPAESYLDALDDSGAAFSPDLNLFPAAWADDDGDRAVVEGANFAHAGRQCYAYVLHKAGIDTFDWVSVQLYEAYSRYLHETTRAGVREVDALTRRIEAFSAGFDVVDVPRYGTIEVRVPPSKLVIGVANGWADGSKFARVDPDALREANEVSKKRHGGEGGVRGFMYWTIEEEGKDGSFTSSALASALAGGDTGADAGGAVAEGGDAPEPEL